MENLDDELRELSPLLRDLKRQPTGLQVPEGYFDNLESQIFDRLDAANARRPAPPLQVIRGGKSYQRRIRLWTALAAGLALAAAAFWFLRPPTVIEAPTPIVQTKQQLPELSEEDVETYLLENIREFDTEQLAALPAVDLVDVSHELPPPAPAPPTSHRTKKQQALDNLHPEDLNNLLNELSAEDLEKLL